MVQCHSYVMLRFFKESAISSIYLVILEMQRNNFSPRHLPWLLLPGCCKDSPCLLSSSSDWSQIPVFGRDQVLWVWGQRGESLGRSATEPLASSPGRKYFSFLSFLFAFFYGNFFLPFYFGSLQDGCLTRRPQHPTSLCHPLVGTAMPADEQFWFRQDRFFLRQGVDFYDVSGSGV